METVMEKVKIIKDKAILIYIAVAVWSIIYTFAISYNLRADPTNKVSISWAVLLSIYSLTPTLASVILFSYEHFGHTSKYWQWFTSKWWLILPLIAVVITPLFDLLNYYLQWGYIVPGTWTSFGLMMLCYLLIVRKTKVLNARIVLIAILGSYLFLSGWEAQYLTRYTIYFWQNPLSFSNVIFTATHVITTLPFAIFVYIYYKAQFSKWTWLWLSTTVIMMASLILSKDFSVAWNGTNWINIEPELWHYFISRASKVTLAFAIVSMSFRRLEKNET